MSPAHSITVGDFDGDGTLDVAVANSDRAVSMLLGNGDGTFQRGGNFGAGNASVAMGDFNGDGRPDLAVANYPSMNVAVLINDTPR